MKVKLPLTIPAHSAWLSCCWQVWFALPGDGDLWEFFCSSDNFSSSWEMHREGAWELKSFQIRNLRAETAVMECIINALRCQATPPERSGEWAKHPDANELLCGPSLRRSDTRTGAGTSLLRCPLTQAQGSIISSFPQREQTGSCSAPHCSVCPCSLQKTIYKGPWGTFCCFSQMLLLSQTWKYLICSYCLIYKCFVLSLLLLFLDYPEKELLCPPAFLPWIIESWRCACSVLVSGPKWEWK